MKPHVICHMVTSVDGRILHSRWRPKAMGTATIFETLHDELGCDAWIVGRVTGQEFAKAKSYPRHGGETFDRAPYLVRRDAKAYGVVLDAEGKIAWGRADIGGDPIITVLTAQVSDAHLAGLRTDGVSYTFAGERSLDLAALLDSLNHMLGIKRVLLEGGGVTNGAFLRAGLVDEVSLVICPAIDGAKGAPSLFDSSDAEANVSAPLAGMSLENTKFLDAGAVWLRYRLLNETPAAG